MSRNNSFVKISQPRMANYLPRERLFSLIDGNCGITWISAPAGSGKTTLAASYLDSRKRSCLWYQLDAGDADLAAFFHYLGLAGKKAAPRYRTPLPLLTPEYMPELPIFVLRYFEKLFDRLGSRFTLVFDNYQDVSNPEFHKIISAGLSVLPPELNVIVISRSPPPAEFSRLLASGKMNLIGWEDIRFSLEESRFFLPDGKLEPIQEKLVEKTEGWAAGLVFIGEAARMNRPITVRAQDEFNPVFDYFANELFDHFDIDTRDFLLKTACLPNVTLEIAEKITGIPNPKKILFYLNRNNLFTQRHEGARESYVYHPLFREFLLTKAADLLPRAEIDRIHHDAALLLEASGKIDAAIELFLQSASWHDSVRAILSQAPILMAQGRAGSLEQWLNALPHEVLAHDPWLLYWLGMCRIPIDPVESRAYFDKAFGLFADAGDIQGRFAAAGGAIHAFVIAWDDFEQLIKWMNTIESLIEEYGSLPPGKTGEHLALSMYMALLYGAPGHAKIAPWEKLLLSLLHRSDDRNYKLQAAEGLLLYYAWKGDSRKAGDVIAIMEPIADSPECATLPKMRYKLQAAIYWWSVAHFDNSEESARDGLKLAEESGIHLVDSIFLAQLVYCRLLRDEHAEVDDLIEKMKQSTEMAAQVKAGHYHHVVAYAAICRNDAQCALYHAEALLGLASGNKGAFPFMTLISRLRMAYALFIGNAPYGEIFSHLDEALKIGIWMQSYYAQAMNSLLRSLVYFNVGEESAGLEALSEGMALNNRYGIFNYEGWRRQDIALVCGKALAAGIEPEYVQGVVRRLKLAPPASVENWPYPVRIYAGETFRIVVDGKPLEFSGKVQKKPLEMLTAIIGHGATGAAEERICDELWPDAEGDRAHQSFTTTLKRLRQLLGHHHAIRLQAGRVTLDPRYCRVDALPGSDNKAVSA
ncbi:MAG: hypothetical protein K2P57_03140 [Burkholderiales bacterium]|nr:hypothetical protein [Burkholderiales bacterium]